MTLSTLLNLSQIQLAPGSSISLMNIPWEQYQDFLNELGDDRITRIAYNQGTLTLSMPSKLHEIVNRLLAQIIVTLAEELGIGLRNLGSATFNREDLDRGIEPDSCFYIQNAHRIIGLNPTIPENLPPDLAVEVDITSNSASKLSLYKALGIPELWAFQGNVMTIHILSNDRYLQVAQSQAFPSVTATQLNQWIQILETADDITVIRSVRAFAQRSVG
ncbi:MAG: Uma2 family endonuclease [Tildeniella nuda ZEHNDER 1965/U140]|jgi:Uma2 family endonuclease|nr:Uma2 family endonuclease [Tildeniella nuda ZEHNDER 1965/U140]